MNALSKIRFSLNFYRCNLLFSRNYVSSRDIGNESESEIWLREASSTGKYVSGNVSAFEDEDGNFLEPTGSLTHATPLRSLKRKAVRDMTTTFVDWRIAKFHGGRGGDGMISLLHLFANELAGPDGGDGGNGGHVILKADPSVKSLANVKSLYFGNPGGNGMSDTKTGKCGEHIYVPVPVGTLVKQERVIKEDLKVGKLSESFSMNKSQFYQVADLSEPGSMFFAAKGGAGGKGNHFFLSNENRKPRVAEVGASGETNIYILEMKTIAHVGLVGFPNVGKSTLLRSISRAKPKVASYPFTTLRPNLGIVHFNDHRQLVVADLPGLIKGAHLNKGLGISFLKHLERCVCLVFVIDLSREDVVEQFETLKYELDQYKPRLSRRPHAIVGNKVDLEISKENLKKLREYVIVNTPKGETPLPIIPISAKFGTNLLEYLKHIRGLYDLYNKPDIDEKGFEW